MVARCVFGDFRRSKWRRCRRLSIEPSEVDRKHRGHLFAKCFRHPQFTWLLWNRKIASRTEAQKRHAIGFGMLKTFITILAILALTQFCSLSFARSVQATSAGSDAPLEHRTELLQLGTRYEHGEGVARDFDQARRLYCEAARLGAAEAYLSLGWMYLNGRGVVRDDNVAVFWLHKAADRGNTQAANVLRLLPTTVGLVKPSCFGNSGIHIHAPVEIRKLVTAKAQAAGVDPKLVLALISAESGFDPAAVSTKNARGLMQLTSETAKRFGVNDPFDIDENLSGGIRFLAYLIKRFHSDVALALAAYNAGESAVDEWGGIPPYEETINYVGRITSMCACSDPKGGKILAAN